MGLFWQLGVVQPPELPQELSRGENLYLLHNVWCIIISIYNVVLVKLYKLLHHFLAHCGVANVPCGGAKDLFLF